MIKPLIGVDVDLTVCPSDQGWISWLELRTGTKLNLTSNKLPYNIGELFNYEDSLDYWRELDYSQFTPIEGSVESLTNMSADFDIVFISSCKGNHHRSKYYWLKDHFPFMKGFFATKEKWLMQDSLFAMIDDRVDVLHKFRKQKRILYATQYEQTECQDVQLVLNTWSDYGKIYSNLVS